MDQEKLKTKRLLAKITKDVKPLLEESLFEPNDVITRNAARVSVENYLSEIKAQRGLYDYSVVCDNTNNLPYDVAESLFQGLPEGSLEDYLIEFDENGHYLYYHDILYRAFDKKSRKFISYFENTEISLVDSNSLNVDIYLKPQKSVDYIIINAKIGT